MSIATQSFSSNSKKNLPNNPQKSLIVLCQQLKLKFKQYNWKLEPCAHFSEQQEIDVWKYKNFSKKGFPLIYNEFGKGQKTTLILGGVHPDEITPIYLAFALAEGLKQKQFSGGFDIEESRIIIAPLVNPDGFLKPQPTRTNASKIDLNRNLPTQNWKLSRFNPKSKEKFLQNSRYFPGKEPNSEPETQFQIWLAKTFSVTQIITIHAPLGFLDYDGPKLEWNKTSKHDSLNLAEIISRSSNNFKVKDYVFFPGSLGTFFGQERNIPTVTLELPSKQPHLAHSYFQKFEVGILQAVAAHLSFGEKL
jgi:murein peptide amidase A